MAHLLIVYYFENDAPRIKFNSNSCHNSQQHKQQHTKYIYTSYFLIHSFLIMGAVHGVYLKYVGLSAISFVGYSMLSPQDAEYKPFPTEQNATHQAMMLMEMIPSLILGYSAILNGIIAILFKAEMGMLIIGKDKITGNIPIWSYLIFFPFHIPTLFYTHLHTWMGKSMHKPPVPVATEVQPG